MGPESKGPNSSAKLRFIFFTNPLLNICLILAVFPWSISCHNGANETDEISASSPEKREENQTVTASVLNGSFSSESDYADTGEIFRNALINHTLNNGGEEDLDKLIFSALPQGSKLVLQSVKVVQTDEHGNPLGKHSKAAPVHWDMKITNATTEPNQDTNEESDEEDETEENDVETSQLTPAETKAAVAADVQSDLASSGSHSQAKYKVYGSKELGKEKVSKQHHGQDHGKTHKITLTDTDGKKVTKYHGKEEGVKDGKNEHGKAQNDEVERYRDTKKKNKGRRVSGFKRVYHKEEFQRTEHFYDDEDAKRIAESYGLKDAKEYSNHGLKDDDRKYHGKKTEYTDGKKIKDEKGTSQGYNKGHQTKYKDTEKHRHNSHYAKSQAHGSPNTHNNNNNNENYHPSHNYDGSHSHTHPKTSVHYPNNINEHHHPNNYFMNFKPGYVQTNFKPSSASHLHGNNNLLSAMAKVPLTASFVLTDLEKQQDTSTASSTDQPSMLKSGTSLSKKTSRRMKSRLDTNSSDENKMYFSPRNRKVVESSNNENEVTTPYINQPRPHYQWDTFPFRTTFRNKIVNISEESRNRTLDRGRERYYPTSSPNRMGNTVRNTLLDPAYGGYSTLVKIMPVNYINLGEEGTNVNGRRSNKNVSQIVASGSRPSSITSGTILIPPAPAVQYRRRPLAQPRPPRGRWITLSVGDPDMVKEVHQSNPLNPNQHHDRIVRPMSISNLVRGVKHRLMRPVYPTRFSPHQIESQYDTSKFPANIVVKSVNGTFSSNNKNKLVHVNIVKNSGGGGGVADHNYISSDNNSVHYPRKPHHHNGVLTMPHGHGQIHINKAPNRHHMPPFMNSLMDSVANFFSNVG